MSDDNVVTFPKSMKDAINAEHWRTMQGEFYLDCYLAYNGKPAESPEELHEWLKEAGIPADMENPFFRGWMVRKLCEIKE